MGYHDDTSELTKTALNVFVDSPYEYYLQFETRQMKQREQTKPMITGIVQHAMFLEQKKLDDLVAVYTSECFKKDKKSLNPKPAEAFRLANAGKFCMKERERDNIAETYDRLKDSAIAHAIAECSEFEKTKRATVYGVPCKCKPDIAGDIGESWVVYDLKFTDSIAGFVKTSRSFRYWLQDAHYSAVIQELTGKPVVFKFIAAETVFPYRVRIYEYDGIKREMAARFHKSKVLDFAACRRSKVWPDRFNGRGRN